MNRRFRFVAFTGLPIRRARKRPSIAERQMQIMASRPVHLPEGADPEMGRLFGVAMPGDGSEPFGGDAAVPERRASPRGPGREEGCDV